MTTVIVDSAHELDPPATPDAVRFRTVAEHVDSMRASLEVIGDLDVAAEDEFSFRHLVLNLQSAAMHLSDHFGC